MTGILCYTSARADPNVHRTNVGRKVRNQSPGQEFHSRSVCTDQWAMEDDPQHPHVTEIPFAMHFRAAGGRGEKSTVGCESGVLNSICLGELTEPSRSHSLGRVRDYAGIDCGI
jgi:hypothetical protein